MGEAPPPAYGDSQPVMSGGRDQPPSYAATTMDSGRDIVAITFHVT